jgi:hypothetical protein
MEKSIPAKKVSITAFAEAKNGRMRHHGRICRQLCSRWQIGDTKMHLWPLLFPLRHIGFDVAEPLTLHGIGGVGFIEGDARAEAVVQTSASRWADYFKHIDDAPLIRHNKNSDFDETGRLQPDAESYSPFNRHEKNDTANKKPACSPNIMSTSSHRCLIWIDKLERSSFDPTKMVSRIDSHIS